MGHQARWLGSGYVRRVGQKDNFLAPAYRLEAEMGSDYLCEYCGAWLILPKDKYEKITPPAEREGKHG